MNPDLMTQNLGRTPTLLDHHDDRVVIVTGASRGIGRSTVISLAQRGWRVVAVDRLPDGSRWGEFESAVTYTQGDVTSAEQMAQVVDIAQSVGSLRACVANAGVLVEGYGGLLDSTPDQWRTTLEVNVIGVLTTFKATLPVIRAAGGGRLLATSSVSSVRAEADLPLYSASKAAVSSIVKSLALQHGCDGISVNALAPGPVETEMQNDVIASRPASTFGGTMDRFRHTHRPMGRMLKPDEVGEMFGWLASDAAAYITGQTIVLDGGGVLL